jgi:hypothetical protein
MSYARPVRERGKDVEVSQRSGGIDQRRKYTVLLREVFNTTEIQAVHRVSLDGKAVLDQGGGP